MSSFADLFDASIGSLIECKQSLVAVLASSPVHEVVDLLKQQQITSIPIYEIVTDQTEISLEGMLNSSCC